MPGRLYAAKYRYLLGRLFSPRSDIRNAAAAADVLCPQETTVGEPAVYLDGQLDKIVRVQDETTLDIEMARIKGGRRLHAPTIAYRIDSPVLLDGALYKGRNNRLIAPPGTVRFRDKEPRHFKTAALSSSYVGIKYFGHWLRDDCSTYLLAKDQGDPLCIRSPEWPDKAAYADLFEQDWSATDRAFIDRLTVLQDFSQNSLKRKRYEVLRTMVRRRTKPANPGGIVYLRRGAGGKPRILENEDALIDALANRGVTVLMAEETSVEAILSALLDAGILITVEGSQQEHAAFALSEQGGVIALQPPDRFNNLVKDWAECLGMAYGFVVGDRVEKGFSIDISAVLRTIDLVFGRLARRE